MSKIKRPNGYWNYETCYDAAKKCNSASEFAKTYPGAVDKARDNGWMKEYTWFSRPEAYNKKWNKETCEVEAKKYKTYIEFERKSGGAYQVACKNKWIDDYTWLKRSHKKGYWQIYENCYNEAKKYKTRTEFAKGNGPAYNSSLQNKWIDKFDWLKDERIDFIKDKIDSVYVYEFIEQHTAYIGRTLMRTQKERDKHHLFNLDSVSSFAKSNNISLPEMKILEENLTLKEGQEKEAFYIEKYRSEGWNVLNKAKAGAIGSLHHINYTYEKVYKEAQKYEYYKDFVKKSRPYYRVAYRNGWIKDFIWLKKIHTKTVKTWTYEMCVEESKKYKSRSEFNKNCNGAYKVSLKNKWLDNFTWLKFQIHPKGYWTYEKCSEESKKYKTLTEWRIKNQTSYIRARDNGWIKDFNWIKNTNKND